MASPVEPKSGLAKETQVPEWEHVAATKEEGILPEHRRSRRDLKAVWMGRLDAALPPHRKYMRMNRNVFLLVAVGGVLALLALIIGLAAGLSRHQLAAAKKNLPLPSNTQTFTGDLTYFDPGLGACGETDSSSDLIVAVSEILFDAAGSSTSTGGNSNANPLCNQMIRATRYDEQVGAMRSVDLKVVDRCTGCKVDDLDTTESAFASLAAIASGRVDVTWAWLQPVATGS